MKRMLILLIVLPAMAWTKKEGIFAKLANEDGVVPKVSSFVNGNDRHSIKNQNSPINKYNHYEKF